jgi:hypothetical protein
MSGLILGVINYELERSKIDFSDVNHQEINAKSLLIDLEIPLVRWGILVTSLISVVLLIVRHF